MARAYGALRCVSNVWDVINDSGHQPKGIKSVEQDTTSVTVFLSAPLDKVTSVSVDVDETFIRYGITVGASVAQDRIVLKFCRDTDAIPRPYLNPNTLDIAYSNLWLVVEDV